MLFSSNEWALNSRFPVNPSKVHKHYRNVIRALETYLLAICTTVGIFLFAWESRAFSGEQTNKQVYINYANDFNE